LSSANGYELNLFAVVFCQSSDTVPCWPINATFRRAFRAAFLASAAELAFAACAGAGTCGFAAVACAGAAATCGVEEAVWSCAATLAASLLDNGTKILDAADGGTPLCVDAWLDGRNGE